MQRRSSAGSDGDMFYELRRRPVTCASRTGAMHAGCPGLSHGRGPLDHAAAHSPPVTRSRRHRHPPGLSHFITCVRVLQLSAGRHKRVFWCRRTAARPRPVTARVHRTTTTSARELCPGSARSNRLPACILPTHAKSPLPRAVVACVVRG